MAGVDSNLLSPWFAILRPLNLLLVAITQLLIFFIVLNPFFSESVDYFLFGLFVLDTLIIGGSGFIINDIVDHKIDVINKPDKCYIPSPISLNAAYKYYIVLIAIGFLIAAYIAFKIDNIPYLAIYPCAVGLLYFYATRYKNSVIIGNVIVSIFVAFVATVLIVWMYPYVNNIADKSIVSHIYSLFIAYGSFSFLVNFARELVKDIEDMEGDKKLGLVTFPIKYGQKLSWNLAGILTLFCTVISLIYILSLSMDLFKTIILIIIITLPMGILGSIMMAFPKQQIPAKTASKILKIILLLGLISILIIQSQ